MVQIIAGNKGKGKTKYLLDKANQSIKDARGSVVYLDKSSKHMYELSNKIRLVNVSEYPLYTADAFVGFILGMISQNRDLEFVFLDSFFAYYPKNHLLIFLLFSFGFFLSFPLLLHL